MPLSGCAPGLGGEKMAPTMNATPSPSLAAVRYTPQTPIESLLHQAVLALKARGVRLGGVIQHDVSGDSGRICQMQLEDIATGRRIQLSQDLGSGSVSCGVDSSGLADASVAIRNAIDSGADLVLINKFGTQEVEGGGLRDEIGLVVAAGVPLLTAVGERYLEAWEEFTGGEAALLEPSLEAILGWWEALSHG